MYVVFSGFGVRWWYSFRGISHVHINIEKGG